MTNTSSRIERALEWPIGILALVIVPALVIFTATIASLFFEQEEQSEIAHLANRLEAIEKNLDLLTEKEQRPVL